MDTRQKTGRYIPQELLRELVKSGNRLVVGIPCERAEGERRLALTPEAVAVLTDCGYRVWVETGAGLGINYSDNSFSEAGAEIISAASELFQADLIVKVQPPMPAEVAWMRPRTTLLSMISFRRFAQEAFEGMMAKRITGVAYELMSDDHQRSPILNVISEIEGAASITIASELLCNTQGGKGVLLGGVPGVSPTEVVIVGAGCAGTVAARAALALGALVKVFDDDVQKLRTIQQVLGQNVFTSTFYPNVLHNAFRSADVVIGAMRYINAQHRYVISEELIQQMKRGALVIDLRMSQGGCFETTCCLLPSDPDVFEQYGVLHYCKTDISNRVARTTSMAFSNLFISLLRSLSDYGSVKSLIQGDSRFRSGVYIYGGRPVNSYVANHFNISANSLDLYLSAF